MWNNNFILVHHGVKGQKWGVRRYQNKDGSLTPEGKRRYQIQEDLDTAKKKLTDANAEVMKNTRFFRPLSKTNREKAKQAHEEAKKYSEEVKSLKELKKLDKKLDNFGYHQNVVLSKANTARVHDAEGNRKWNAAAKAGKGSKEWSEWQQHCKKYTEKYKDEFVKAWMKDNNIKKISDRGRKFVYENYRI